VKACKLCKFAAICLAFGYNAGDRAVCRLRLTRLYHKATRSIHLADSMTAVINDMRCVTVEEMLRDHREDLVWIGEKG